MKRSLPLVLVLTLLLCACGGETVTAADASLADIREELILTFAVEEPVRLTDDYVTLLYGIDTDLCSECAALRLPGPLFPGEAVMLKAKDAEALSVLLGALEDSLENIRTQSRDYDPESYALAEKSRVCTKGPYAGWFFGKDQDAMEKLFLSHIKEYPAGEAPVFTPAPSSVPAPMPSAEPTPAAAPEPEPTAAPVPLPYGLVPERERVDDRWWDDVMLVGNSVMGNLDNYTVSQRLGERPGCLGKAYFLDVTTFNYASAVGELHAGAKYPSIPGHGIVTVDEAAALLGVKKVMLNMGYGDLVYRPDDLQHTVDNAAELVRRIRERCGEDTEIYILGVTPRLRSFDHRKENNARFRDLNEALLVWCSDPANRCWFVNCFEALTDEDGYLDPTICSDADSEGIHLTYEGCRRWVDYLYTHTAPTN